ncbi:ABC transporter ATP-binding protein [Aedoeadaptatus acetigenes]|uniref:ABC transporter ATP-binding protein n=1 Tax=Aedoeadaptatus acetigenes TaxID=2981723 RepID=UPI0011DC97CC|nr:ABC transporter ATP-binding protein [Aedoeadaptatus acetigenes]MCU6786512.1 ABC transporter ATP-binding protein [Aedoeadaptatus acetigenes]
MSFIEINNLRKSFGNTEVLHGLNLKIARGQLATLLGPSGCGKSTLLRAIAGLNTIDEGEIIIDGRRVDGLAPKDRGLGMVFQHYALFPNMNVLDNVKFGLDMKGVDKKTRDTEAKKMIDLVGLAGKEEAYPTNLSGGQQQRVALARSLVTKPDVLLLDEPLSALDAQIRVQLRGLIKSLQAELGITVILVTHDQEEAMSMSDYIFVMNQGHIVQEGSPTYIYRHPQSEFATRFIGDYNLFTKEEAAAMGADDHADYSYVAIRPEVLSLEAIDDAYVYEGKVIRTSMRGSIYRLYIELDGKKMLKLDQLNRSANMRRVGDKVTVYMPKSEIIGMV